AAVAEVQDKLGREAAGHAIEQFLADVGRKLVAAGFRRLLVAGGGTAGAIRSALGLQGLGVGPEIDPRGARARSEELALALKSGNFGAPDFLLKAWERLA